MKQDARFLAVTILNRFENKHEQLGLIRNQVFSQFKPEPLSKSRATVLANETVRLKGRLDLMIEFISGKSLRRLDPSLRSILQVGFYEILFDESVPDYAAVDSAVNLTKGILNRKASGLTNAVLRNLIRKKDTDTNWDGPLREQSGWHSLPDWIQARWIDQLGKKGFLDLTKRINQAPVLFVRVHSNTYTMDDIIRLLKGSDIGSERFSESFLTIHSGAGQILETGLFQTGHISIQDPASGAVADCMEVKAGQTVLDVCAAPGTKSLYIAGLVGEEGQVLASDLSPERVNRGRQDLNRHGLKNIRWSVKDAVKDEYPDADRILIDAPCTGTGVMCRKPDIRWRRKPGDILELSTLQLRVLCHVSQFLKPNGTLVYATCSIEPEENWDVVEQFLKLNADFIVQDVPSTIPGDWVDERGCLYTLPHLHGVDGMFAAKLKRS